MQTENFDIENGTVWAQQRPEAEPEPRPAKKPEVEPGNLPDEEPGRQEPERKKEDDDDDDYEPYQEPEIGDDPDEIKTGTIIM